MLRAARTLGGVLVVSALLCAGNLCISASKEGGQVPYISVTATLLIEVLKLALMLAAIAVTRTPMPAAMPLREAALYAVPSFLYMVDNNLNYVILRFMDPATLAVLWNLKILTTAVLFRLVLKRQLSELRKIAVVLLLLGVVTSQSDHLEKQAVAAAGTDAGAASSGSWGGDSPDPRNFALGLVLVLVGVTISSCASVFTEWAFKRRSDCPFMWQNVLLYVYGILFNALALLVEREEIATRGFFHGYNGWTAAVIVVNCVGGISMGLVLKFLDNMACVYSHAVAMMLTMLFSMLFFRFSPSLEFACGLAVVVISMYLYHHKVEVKDAGSPTCSSSEDEAEDLEAAALPLEADDSPSDSTSLRPHDKLQVVGVDGLHLKKMKKKTRYEKLPTDTINGGGGGGGGGCH